MSVPSLPQRPVWDPVHVSPPLRSLLVSSRPVILSLPDLNVLDSSFVLTSFLSRQSRHVFLVHSTSVSLLWLRSLCLQWTLEFSSRSLQPPRPFFGRTSPHSIYLFLRHRWTNSSIRCLSCGFTPSATLIRIFYRDQKDQFTISSLLRYLHNKRTTEILTKSRIDGPYKNYQRKVPSSWGIFLRRKLKSSFEGFGSTVFLVRYVLL